MQLLIGIATFKRIEKLKRLLDSLENQTHQDFVIYVVCDNNDIETANYLASLEDNRIKYWINDEHKFVVGAWNHVVNFCNDLIWDGFIGLVDDVELRPNALEEIVNHHKFTFPTGDGVVGFNQECYGNKKYTFQKFVQTLMDRKFIERYKNVDYHICCPYYKHFFQDEEMYNYAYSLGCFSFCSTAILDHDHPGFTGSVDETHHITRSGVNSPKEHDIKLFQQRQKNGNLWPLS